MCIYIYIVSVVLPLSTKRYQPHVNLPKSLLHGLGCADSLVAVSISSTTTEYTVSLATFFALEVVCESML